MLFAYFKVLNQGDLDGKGPFDIVVPCSLFQMTYSMTRFAIYETVRDKISSQNQGPMPFYQKILLAAFGGKNIDSRIPLFTILLYSF